MSKSSSCLVIDSQMVSITGLSRLLVEEASSGLSFYCKEQVSKVSSVLEQSLSPPYDQNLSEILNLLYNRGFNKPADFWNAVGKVFKIYMIVDQNPNSQERKFCSILRTLALHMFRKWQSNCSVEDGAMGEEEKDQRESISAKPSVSASKGKPSILTREE